MKHLKILSVLQVVLLLACTATTCFADSNEDRRLRIGAKLFRTLLAADLGLEQRVDDDGRLRVLIVTDDPDSSDEIVELIGGGSESAEKTIRGIPLVIEFARELGTQEALYAGVFIASNTAVQSVSRIAQWGIEQHTIVYSPFEGHVEQGVLAGLSVEARVRPYINNETLVASGIKLKPFFLQVARIHE